MVDVVVDAKPAAKLPYDPSDIPESVRKRAAAVDALYGAQSGNGQAAPEPAPAPAPTSAPAAPVSAATPQSVTAEPSPPSPPPPPPAPTEDDSAESWKRKFLRMQGQYTASQKTIGELQEQMTQLGDALMSAQQQAPSSPPPNRRRQEPPPAPSYLTEQDVQNYGGDLVDFAQRAAVHATAPLLQEVRGENEALRKQLAVEARRRLDQAVELAVPNFRQIDQDPRWHMWLRGIDAYSGRVRQQLLNDAIAAAEAPRVISFFRGFQIEEAATGHTEQPAPSTLQAAAPREAAVPLASLATPGRARPATGGDPSLPPDKPVYTRAQIKQLYEQHRRGAYIGREAEWARQDADIIAAGREGRIRNPGLS